MFRFSLFFCFALAFSHLIALIIYKSVPSLILLINNSFFPLHFNGTVPRDFHCRVFHQTASPGLQKTWCTMNSEESVFRLISDRSFSGSPYESRGGKARRAWRA
jgi:hypothetical protein